MSVNECHTPSEDNFEPPVNSNDYGSELTENEKTIKDYEKIIKEAQDQNNNLVQTQRLSVLESPEESLEPSKPNNLLSGPRRFPGFY